MVVGSTPPVPDCTRCTYSMGQSWLIDPLNCHMYYICEKIDVGASYYRLHHPTCGSMYWDQGSLTCVSQKTDDCTVDDVVTNTPPSGTDGKQIRGVQHHNPCAAATALRPRHHAIICYTSQTLLDSCIK